MLTGGPGAVSYIECGPRKAGTGIGGAHTAGIPEARHLLLRVRVLHLLRLVQLPGLLRNATDRQDLLRMMLGVWVPVLLRLAVLAGLPPKGTPRKGPLRMMLLPRSGAGRISVIMTR